MMELLIAVALVAVVLVSYLVFDKMSKKALGKKNVSPLVESQMEPVLSPEAEQQMEYYLENTIFLLDPYAILSFERQ